MPEPNVTVVGADRLAMTMRAAAHDLADMSTSNRAVGEVVRARAASLAPKVTGRLAGSVRPSYDGGEVVIASGLVYAPPINYGWPAHNIVAQPFMVNAVEDSRTAVVARYSSDVGQAIKQIKGA